MNAFERAHRARRRFSTEDMIALMAPGITMTEAARRLGVSRAAVAVRLKAEGLIWPETRFRFDDDTFARLWNCHAIPTGQIARALGVTRQAVSDRAHRMGLPGRDKLRRTKVRRDELRDLWLAGVASKDIARHFGLKSHTCVSNAVGRAGLPRRRRGKGGKTRCGWIGTIPIEAYADQRLAAIMAAEAGPRATQTGPDQTRAARSNFFASGGLNP